RRQHRDVQPPPCPHPESPSLSRRRPSRVDLGFFREEPSQRSLVRELRRLEGPAEFVREARALSMVDRQHHGRWDTGAGAGLSTHPGDPPRPWLEALPWALVYRRGESTERRASDAAQPWPMATPLRRESFGAR